jgi:hypothetical protein
MIIDVGYVNKIKDTGTSAGRVLAMAWDDANDHKWPTQNPGQRKSLIEEAIGQLRDAGILFKSCVRPHLIGDKEHD